MNVTEFFAQVTKLNQDFNLAMRPVTDPSQTSESEDPRDRCQNPQGGWGLGLQRFVSGATVPPIF